MTTPSRKDTSPPRTSIWKPVAERGVEDIRPGVAHEEVAQIAAPASAEDKAVPVSGSAAAGAVAAGVAAVGVVFEAGEDDRLRRYPLRHECAVHNECGAAVRGAVAGADAGEFDHHACLQRQRDAAGHDDVAVHRGVDAATPGGGAADGRAGVCVRCSGRCCGRRTRRAQRKPKRRGSQPTNDESR
ncbi:MAG: hypothetical protein R2856_35665 [Caldilineaceae bacterium]